MFEHVTSSRGMDSQSGRRGRSLFAHSLAETRNVCAPTHPGTQCPRALPRRHSGSARPLRVYTECPRTTRVGSDCPRRCTRRHSGSARPLRVYTECPRTTRVGSDCPRRPPLGPLTASAPHGADSRCPRRCSRGPYVPTG